VVKVLLQAKADVHTVNKVWLNKCLRCPTCSENAVLFEQLIRMAA
jgi:hypothetical protein